MHCRCPFIDPKWKKAVLFFVISLLSLSFISGNVISSETVEDELPHWIHEQMGTDPEDPFDIGIYVLYDTNYLTRDYNCWKTYVDSNSTESLTIATESVVVRRGTEIEISGPKDADPSITPSKRGMTPLQVESVSNGWTISIPEQSSVGKYVFTLSQGNWTDELEIFVIYDPWAMGISTDELKAYAYDENSDRPEKDYIITTAYEYYEGVLRPFGDEREGWPDMYEFALAAVGNTSDPQEAAARIVRVVAQRNVAVPSDFPNQPIIRDASQILFGSGKTVIHGRVYDYEGLTVEDGEKLSSNGVSIPGIQGLTANGTSKLINGWCDEVSWAKTALLRSVGIPSRVASVIPSLDTEYMGHFMAEVWFEESLYKKDWDDNEGGWYVLDADEWNAEWYTEEYFGRPVFWMVAGECFSSRSNYGRMSAVLFEGTYKIEKIYVSGTNEISQLDDFIDVTVHYVYGKELLLDYGTLTKLKGRGGGDFYKVEVRTNSRLSIESSQHVNASLYVSSENYPFIPILSEGYPFSSPLTNHYGEEVILGRGTYYVSIFAPKNGDPAVEGDYGPYTLTLERTPNLEPTFTTDEEVIESETGIQRYYGHIFGILLLFVWGLSYVFKKKTS